MALPRISDDGATVTLDLHGATVAEAMSMVSRLVTLAARRGRSRVKIIHGSSTSDARYRNRTVKHALYDWLDAHETRAGITAVWRDEGAVLLSLPIDPAPDHRRILLTDLRG